MAKTKKLSKAGKASRMLAKMIRIVTAVYVDKLDMKKKAAILQPIKVMMKLSRSTPEVKTIAIAKDLLKMSEGSITLEDLRTEGFSKRVIDALELLHKDPEEDYKTFVEKVSKNKDASLVLRFDLKYRTARKHCDTNVSDGFSAEEAYAFLSNQDDDDGSLNLKLAEMIAIAAEAHEDQLDKGDHAYILHPFRILMDLSNEDIEIRIAAVGHDVIEDSEGRITLQTFIDKKFPQRSIDCLDCLTHRDGVSYPQYIIIIMSNGDAVIVKKGDIRDNSNILRLKGIRAKDFLRVNKYSCSYLFLEGKIDEDTYLEKVEEFI